MKASLQPVLASTISVLEDDCGSAKADASIKVADVVAVICSYAGSLSSEAMPTHDQAFKCTDSGDGPWASCWPLSVQHEASLWPCLLTEFGLLDLCKADRASLATVLAQAAPDTYEE